MSIHEDLYSKEASLINDSQRELDDGLEKDPIHKLTLLCLSHGSTGILKLARAFRNTDVYASKAINLQEFMKGIHKTGLDCTDEEIRDMFARFDENGVGSIKITDFLVKLRPPIQQSRLDIIDKAFKKMDPNGTGVITIGDFKSVYSVKEHPKYQNGDMTKNEILTKFLNNFEDGPIGNDVQLTKEEFLNYYAIISKTIDNDTYFDLLMRQTYSGCRN